MIEHEVKLQFDDVEAARRAVETAGARLVVARRLLDDQLFDLPDAQLRQSGRALRLRRDGSRSFLTFKGPVQVGPLKSREELEISVGDAALTAALLASLGYRPAFRLQKFRREYELGGARVTLDEAPVGIFVEIEGQPDAITHVTRLLGRTPADHRLESYLTLWRRWCDDRQLAVTDMVFDTDQYPL